MTKKQQRQLLRTLKKYRDPLLLLGMCAAVLVGAVLHAYPGWVAAYAAPLSPQKQGVVATVEVDYIDENIDGWIRYYSARFANSKKPESYLKYQLHCLANKESGHRHDNHKKCGDGGKSCVLFQYREATWNGFRKIMMKQGLVSEIGSLWDDKKQVETTAWALADGRDMNWGPITRGDCK